MTQCGWVGLSQRPLQTASGNLYMRKRIDQQLSGADERRGAHHDWHTALLNKIMRSRPKENTANMEVLQYMLNEAEYSRQNSPLQFTQTSRTNDDHGRFEEVDQIYGKNEFSL